MKKLTSLIAFLYTGMAMAQKSNFLSSSNAGQVTNAVLYVSPGFNEGCNNAVKHFQFTAYITTDGPCTVKYAWDRSDGASDSYAPRLLEFTTAGTQSVTTTWDLSPSSFDGWESLRIMGPNNFQSQKALFRIICCNTPAASSNLTPNALSLLQSFQQLVSRTGTRVCNTSVNAICVSSTMPVNGFSYSVLPGELSFTSFFLPTPDANYFRVIWGGAPGNFTYYGACPPDRIIFPLDPIAQNHVFAAKLVKTTQYQTLSPSARLFLNIPSLHPADIISIENPRLEGRGGYIATNEPAGYNNVFSSLGIVVTARLRGGESVDCYLLNNYDGAGTLIWKRSLD